MTGREVKELYVKLLIMSLEDIDERFKNIEKAYGEGATTIMNNDRRVDIFDDDEAGFDEFVCIMIVRAILWISGITEEENFKKNVGNLGERVEDLFQKHLLVPTHKFTAKYGLPTIKKAWIPTLEIWAERISK